MFGSNVLDTAIGMVFIYSFLSLLVSAANELLASFLQWRSQTLIQGMQTFLGDSSGKVVVQLMTHPLLKGLAPAGKSPSYIPSHNFAVAVLDLVFPERPPGSVFSFQTLTQALEKRIDDPSARLALQALLARAGGRFDNALHLIEKGFNDVMDRASGWYKRKIALVTLILGLFLALALNADSLELTGRLYNDPAVRAALAAEAQAAVQKVQPEGTTADPAQITQQVLQQSQALTPLLGNWPETPDGKNQGFWWFFKVLGILLTGFAVSLGAPFWFDTLGKLVSLRGAGPKPAPPANRVNEDSAGV